MHILSLTLGEKKESRRFYHRSQTINHLLRLHFFQPWVCLNPTSLPTSVCMYLMRVKCLGSTTLLDGEKREHRNYGRQKVSLLRTPVICSPDSRGIYLWRAEEMVWGRNWALRGPWRNLLISPRTLRSVLVTTMPSGKKEELSNHFQPSV